MSANTDNAMLYLITTLFDLALGLFLLRVLLQIVRGDFYNPISQLVWRATQPLVAPFARVLPRYRNFDLVGAIWLFSIAFSEIECIAWWLPAPMTAARALWFALLKISTGAFSLYTLTTLVQAILTLVGPGVSNPATNILFSLNEPLLRPIRRLLPLVSGIDLSPFVVMLAMGLLDRLTPLDGIFRSGLFY